MCVGALNTLTARVVQQVESFAAAAALQLPSLLKTLNAVPFYLFSCFFLLHSHAPSRSLLLFLLAAFLYFVYIALLTICSGGANAATSCELRAACFHYLYAQSASRRMGRGKGEVQQQQEEMLLFALCLPALRLIKTQLRRRQRCCCHINKQTKAANSNSDGNRNRNRKSNRKSARKEDGRGGEAGASATQSCVF